MSNRSLAAGLAAILITFSAPPALAQMQSPTGTQQQRDAIARLGDMDGEWRGTAVIYSPSGPMTLTQTERIGTMLGGSVRVIEGRGYAADGSVAFNALGIISWDTQRNAYNFRSYAQGYQGDFPFEVTADGFRWQTPAGPGATIQYVATVGDGRWREVGSYVRDGQPPMPYFEMNLTRIGNTGWPAEGAVAPGE